MTKKHTLKDHDALVGGFDDDSFEYADFSRPQTQYEAMMKNLCNEICRTKRESGLNTKMYCQKVGISEATYSNINLRKIPLLSMDSLFQVLEKSGDARAIKRMQLAADILAA